LQIVNTTEWTRLEPKTKGLPRLESCRLQTVHPRILRFVEGSSIRYEAYGVIPQPVLSSSL
jgi:hypothetical protein